MSDPLDRWFAHRGASLPDESEHRVSDEQLAAYLDGALDPAESRAIEDEALTSPALYELLRAAVDAIGATPVPERPLRVSIERIREGTRNGLRLLNPFQLLFEPRNPSLALGGLRSGTVAADLFTVRGPGRGLDALDLQILADGSLRLEVVAEQLPEVAAGETLSVVREQDGALRDRRPLGAGRVEFDGIEPGLTTIRIEARAPGGTPRSLSEAQVDLKS